MGRIIVIIGSLIVTTIFTLYTFWLPNIGDKSTIEIINRLPLLISPASYVYIFWFFLFIVLFIWAFSYSKNRKSESFVSPLQTILFFIAMLLQILSIYLWNKEMLFYSLICIGLQLFALFALYLTYPMQGDYLKKRMPIAIYFGWTTFIFIINACYLLVYNEWNRFGLSDALWAVIILTFATLVALHLRYHHHDIAYPLVFVWCFIGIAIANGFDELLVTTSALFLSGVLIVGVLFMKKNPVRL
ncbi:hypothetical protein [Ureibacillus terrenus]|uniref:Tryptophan-rich sensory protein n=1 Tax=Ureibacillus terrenus TaxID=118246 RepID=A0A540V393_9BACL|nr:hypothetical protein [Ureibacillus terrenus]TQE91198.1 hypothetical protein FKZ59_06010 [Ureibacillus terrenus]